MEMEMEMEMEMSREMEAPMPPASRQALTPSPERLRQRQRDRLTPRGRTSKEHRIATTVREVQDANSTEVRLSPAPRMKGTGALSPDMSRKRRQDDVRQDNNAGSRGKGSREEGKFDITPDGGSAGREGRQFTVANVGNNGRIYLRPTIRPANQRYPQPAFVFPITPPSTAGLETLVARNEEDASHRDSLWTSARSPPPTPVKRAQERSQPDANMDAQPRPGRRRVHSYSTVDDQHGAVQDSDFGAFRIVIERPGTARPKTAEDFDGVPMLEVPIPSYRLGTPRFSVRGTPFLRGSSYAGTDDIRESLFSHSQQDVSQLDRNTLHPHRIVSRRHSHTSPQSYYIRTSSSPSFPLSLPSPNHTHRAPISPEMFDVLTFKPACDDPSLVRYSSATGSITAATPPRLVAEITSPSFVDYDLLSDFFLTFRSFLSTSDLLAMLIARLRWALARDDETGMVVRVRTFVAIRHWILNYFMDDFALDYFLRLSFCELVNAFVDDVIANPKPGKNQLKILGELKKCWRRNCSLYWDSPEEFSPALGPEVAVTPGGIAGSREPQLTPSFWDRTEENVPQLNDILDNEDTAGHNFFADVSRAGHNESTFYRPQTPPEEVGTQRPYRDGPSSPGSMMSDDVLSCSFPTKSKIGQLGAHNPLGAHPVSTSSRYDNSSPVAHLPKVPGRAGRPSHAHKRSGSFSDSLRDYRGNPVDKVLYKGTELVMAMPHGGSLVRGALFPPGQAFVEALVPSAPATAANRGTTYFTSADDTQQKGPSAMSAPGMKKLLGSVRRALSNRAGQNPNSVPITGVFPQIGVRGVTVNRLPGTAVVPQARARNTGSRAPMRIDLLGAGIAEDFKKAVREDAEADADRRQQEQRNSMLTIGKASGNEKMYPSMQPDDTYDDPDKSWLAPDRTAVSAITNGSMSIVIVDDTLPLGLPVMTGALPANPSTDSFAEDAYLHPSGGPTPPATPPEQTVGSPRRSSHLLGENVFNRHRSLSLERTPPLVNDNNSPSEVYRSPSFRDVGRPSMQSYGKSFRSGKSISLRRYASYHSGFTRHQTERSFDATTFSGSINPPSEAQPPAPLRVLRRRPGGDLRAATNVGELNEFPLRRPRSAGSLTTYSDSVRSSDLFGRNSTGDVEVLNYDTTSQGRVDTFSLGALAGSAPKRGASLFSTHSSQPVMRPSFEAEAAKLAQIPDDVDDDGGVESALLKLEGKYEQRKSDLSSSSFLKAGTFDPSSAMEIASSDVLDEDEKLKRRQKHIIESNISKTPPLLDAYRPEPLKQTEKMLKPAVYQPRKPTTPVQVLKSRASEESFSSIPILQRSDSYHKAARRQSRNWSHHSILRGPSQERDDNDLVSPESSHPSIDFINETESLKRIPAGGTFPRVASRDQSFLNDDSDNDSALSSELSMEIISRVEYNGGSSNTFPPVKSGTIITQIALPSHPLRHPSSPPMTMTQALSMSPELTQVPQLHVNQLQNKDLPPTPEVTPTLTDAQGFGKRSWEKSDEAGRLRPSNKPSEKSSVHLPFILAFDSKVLAQQFTLIEKDALNEIDWKELIEMRWKNTSPTSRSWVNFLRTEGARGVDVVIARFNIMVKWAVSEIVLTKALEERVQVIIKYIHVAAHCRKYRNYATMYQLTVALTSNDVSRLIKTWRHVPAGDMATLKELEDIVQPTRNFHNLRAEMEGGGGDQGCIPFVGIYTHDLLFNSQRPSQIASTPTTEPLVNFERCRTSAAIVKNLLRLLEASQLYRFQPIEGITERCLWMAALSDTEIRRYGELIE